MLLSLVDLLRCTGDHEETWLVASVDAWGARGIRDGSLGCPVCGRVFPIAGGTADFRDGRQGRPPGAGQAPGSEEAPSPMRLAALLGLGEGGGVVLLAGQRARDAGPLASLVEVSCLLVNPAGEGGEAAAVLVADRIPVAAGSIRAVALDADAATPALLPGFVRALRPGGRLVAPAGAAVPAGVRELARDDREWVAERVAAASPPVPLARRLPVARPGDAPR